MHPPPFNPGHVIADWPDCHLELGCPKCSRVTVISLRMFQQDYSRVRVIDLVSRLRCQECRLPAAPVYLCASHYRARTGGGGPSPDWALELVPAHRPAS